MTEYVYITDIVKVKSRVPYYEIEELESSQEAFSQMIKDPDRLGNIEKTVNMERITPEEFVDAFGRHSFVGLSRKVQEDLGLPMEAFITMKEELETLRWDKQKLYKAVNALSKDVLKYEEMTFWQRVKFCFKRD